MSAELRWDGRAPGGAPAAERGGSPSAADAGATERFAALHAVTAALSAALTPSEVAAAIATRGAALPGACGCAVGVLAATGALDVTFRRGATARVSGDPLARPVAPDSPLAIAAREARTVLSPGAGACLAGGPSGGALVALPLRAGGAVLGAVGLEFSAPARFDEEELAFVEAFAHQAAQGLERARLYEAERTARVEAQRAAEAARRAVELSGQLVGIVGHDLRTPLSAIRMSAAVLLRRGGLTDEQARTLARIDGSAGRMARIIHDLLDFTRIRNEGRIPVHPRPAELVAVVRRAVAELAAAHPTREIAISAPDEVALEADPDRLDQVLTNLVANALQHGPPDARVTVTVALDGGGAAIAVHNDGPPIRPEVLGEIFEPFRRAGRGGDGGSLGLGLFIVREVVRAHGGQVDVRTGDAEGTTFTVRLPAPPAAPARGVTAPDR